MLRKKKTPFKSWNNFKTDNSFKIISKSLFLQKYKIWTWQINVLTFGRVSKLRAWYPICNHTVSVFDKCRLYTRCSPSKSGDLEDMDAWEISMRLDMADIQKKYRYFFSVFFNLNHFFFFSKDLYWHFWIYFSKQWTR